MRTGRRKMKMAKQNRNFVQREILNEEIAGKNGQKHRTFMVIKVVMIIAVVVLAVHFGPEFVSRFLGR